jgi:hypothetical protein
MSLPRQDVGKRLQTDRSDIVRHHVLRNAGAEEIERRGILPPVGRGLDARGGLRPRRHGGIGENQYRDDAGCSLQRSEHDPLSLTAFPHSHDCGSASTLVDRVFGTDLFNPFEPTFARFPAVLGPGSPPLSGLGNGKSRLARAFSIALNWEEVRILASKIMMILLINIAISSLL